MRGAMGARHAKMVRLLEYQYLIISTRAGWNMIKFKIHALECARTRHFYVKKIQKFSAEGAVPPPQTHPPAGGGHPRASNSLAPALIFIQIFVVGSEIRMCFEIQCVMAVQGHRKSLILVPI